MHLWLSSKIEDENKNEVRELKPNKRLIVFSIGRKIFPQLYEWDKRRVSIYLRTQLSRGTF